jgi:hypothetical protein
MAQAHPLAGSDDLNIGIAGAGEELVMLVNTEEFHSRLWGVFFAEPGHSCIRTFICFGDDDKRGLRTRKTSRMSGQQVGPPEVGFYGRHQIEGVLRERQVRDRAFANLDAGLLDPFSVRSAATAMLSLE